MWTAYSENGEQFYEGAHSWKDVRHKGIIKLESVFGNEKVIIEIPTNATPVVFNTGEFIIKPGGSPKHKQLSQAIGYCDGKQEYYTRIFYDGRIEEETGPVIH